MLAALLPVFWPLLTGTGDTVNNLSGTDPATTLLKTLWPIALLVIGIGLAVAVIFYALRKFGVLSGGKGGMGL